MIVEGLTSIKWVKSVTFFYIKVPTSEKWWREKKSIKWMHIFTRLDVFHCNLPLVDWNIQDKGSKSAMLSLIWFRTKVAFNLGDKK